MKHDYAGDLLSAVTEIVDFAKDQALYDVQCRVNEQLAKCRQEKFASEARLMHKVTLDLASVKLKLDLLKVRIVGYPEELKAALEPLFAEGHTRIEELRRIRNSR